MKKVSTLIAAIALVSSAQAATVSFQYGLPLVESTTEISQTGLLGLFDSNLGTLTDASLQIFGAATTTISLRNTGNTTQNGRANSSVDLLWSSSLGALDARLVQDLAMTFSTGGAQSYAVGQSRSFGPLTDSDSFSYNLASILGSLQALGGGSFGLTCDSLSGITVLGGGGNLASTQTTTAGCGASILYTYTQGSTQIPEPASLALVGLALAAVSVATRRRNV